MLGLILLGLVLPAHAAEVELFEATGDGYAVYGVDEFGTLRGCGNTGIVFDPVGPVPAAPGSPLSWANDPASVGQVSQANCAASLYLFETSGGWRQQLANGAWYYHPSFATGFGNAPTAYVRPTDTLATAADVLSDATNGDAQRVTRFKVASYPALEVELEQTVCGSALYQEYTYELMSGPSQDVRVTRIADADLEWGTRSFGRNYNYNLGYGITPAGATTAAVAATDDLGQVDYSVEMSGDAAVDGWRLWQCRYGGASEFARMMTADGWASWQLNHATRCTGGAWWSRTETLGTATVTPSPNDTTLGVQGVLSLNVGEPQSVVYVTELGPGAPKDGWSATASAAPDSLWPPDGSMTSISVDVEQSGGCGVSCAITGVSANQALSPANTPQADYDITGDLTVNLRQEMSGNGRVYTIELTCEDHFGNLTFPTSTVTVENPFANFGGNGQGYGNGQLNGQGNGVSQ